MFRIKEISMRGKARGRRFSTSGSVLLELAVMGGLLGGAAGIFKAIQMERPTDILLCLFGSFTACGLICYVYFRRD